MPRAPARVAIDRDSEAPRCGFADGTAVVLRVRCVAERLARQIAAVTDQLAEEDDVVVRPRVVRGGLGETARERDPVARRNVAHPAPPVAGADAVVARRAEHPSGRQADREHLALADRPDLVATSGDEAVPFIDGYDFGLPPHELADRHAAAVGEDDERVAGDALAKIGEDRLLVVALLDGA